MMKLRVSYRCGSQMDLALRTDTDRIPYITLHPGPGIFPGVLFIIPFYFSIENELYYEIEG